MNHSSEGLVYKAQTLLVILVVAAVVMFVGCALLQGLATFFTAG